MTIVRDGKRIVLTQQELREAYDAYDLECKKQDIADKYESRGKTIPDAENLEMLANRLSRNLSRNDGYFEDYWGTLEVTIDEYEGEF